MKKPDAKKWPLLKKAWDEYGHCMAWEQLVDIKAASHYAALAWKEGDSIQYADMARTEDGWEMINDGGDDMTVAEWNSARVDEWCERLVFPKKTEEDPLY